MWMSTEDQSIAADVGPCGRYLATRQVGTYPMVARQIPHDLTALDGLHHFARLRLG